MTTQEKEKTPKSQVGIVLEMIEERRMKRGWRPMVYGNKAGNSGVYIPKRKKPSSTNKN